MVRKATLDAHPDLNGLLEGLASKLSDDIMQRLNGEVDVKKKSVEEVATAFLKEQGLL